MIGLALALAVGGFLVSLVATAALIRAGRRLGMLDSPGVAGHEKGLRAVPNIGGIAVFWVLAAPITLGLIAIAAAPDALERVVPAVAPWLDRLGETTPTAIAFLGALALMHVVGLVDDRRGLAVAPKVLAQVACGVVLATWFDVRLLTVLDGWLGWGSWPSIVVTVGWIVVVTNALNYLDNMDGVTAGIAVVSGGLFMIAALLGEQWFVAATLALLVGGCGGFLWWNRPPARIFLGDSGSLVIGMALAVLTARMTWYDPAATEGIGTAWYGIFMPLAVLAIPLYDFTTVTGLRIAQGRSPFKGDQQHFSHRLAARGLGDRGALAVIWTACGACGVAGLLLGHATSGEAIALALLVALIIAVIAILDFGAWGDG